MLGAGALDGLRVVEGSAFVAAPLGGMTLAQLGADVIRFDTIGGGIDYQRWPVTPTTARACSGPGSTRASARSPSTCRSPEGRELVTAADHRAGRGARHLPVQLPASRLARRRAPAAPAGRPGLRQHRRQPRREHRRRLHGEPGVGHRLRDRPGRVVYPANHVLPAWDIATGLNAVIGLLAAERKRTRTGDGQLVKISLADVAFTMVANLGYLAQAQVLARGPAAARQRHVRRVRPRLPHRRRPPGHGRRHQPQPVADAGRRRPASRSTCRRWSARSAPTSPRRATATAAATRIAALLTPWFATARSTRSRKAFDAHGVCWGPYQTFTQLLDDDWRVSEANPVFGDVDQPGIGTLRTPASPLTFAPPSRRDARAGAAARQHTDEVLADVLGCRPRRSAAARRRRRRRARRERWRVELTLADAGVRRARARPGTLDAGAHVAARARRSTPEVLGPAMLPALWHWAFFRPGGADRRPRRRRPPRRRAGDGGVPPAHVGRAAGSATRGRCASASTPSGRRASCNGRSEGRAARGASGWSRSATRSRRAAAPHIEEEQDLVLRDPRAAGALPVEPRRRGRPRRRVGRGVRRRPTLLFRYSALTFNAHRIHYDEPYATGVEGYPDLVVQGPLTAMTVAGFIEQTTGRRLSSYEFKATAPMFADLRSTIVVVPPAADGTGTAEVLRNDGAVAMRVDYAVGVRRWPAVTCTSRNTARTASTRRWPPGPMPSSSTSRTRCPIAAKDDARRERGVSYLDATGAGAGRGVGADQRRRPWSRRPRRPRRRRIGSLVSWSRRPVRTSSPPATPRPLTSPSSHSSRAQTRITQAAAIAACDGVRTLAIGEVDLAADLGFGDDVPDAARWALRMHAALAHTATGRVACRWAR